MEDLNRSASKSIVRWEILTYLGIANFLCLYCFYLPGALYAEGAVPLVAPQFTDLVKVGSFMSFVLGLAARPIGAVFFGLTGDSEGSKTTLVHAGYLLAVVTLLMGLVPSFEYLGLGTPILNITLRILQGFAIGGTFSSIALLTYDAAPAGEKCRFTCFVQVTAPAGYLSSLAVVLVLKILCGDTDFADWGWRFSFLAGLPLIYFLRKIQTTPCPFEVKPFFPNKIAVFKSVVQYFVQLKPGAREFLFYVLPTTGIIGITTFMGTVYQLYFFQNILRIDPMLVKFILALSSLLYLPMFFLWGAISDVYDKRKIIFVGVVASTLATIPFYILFENLGEHLKNQSSLNGGYTWLMIIAVSGLSSIVVIAFSPLIAFLGEVLPKEHRNTLYATSYNFGFGLLISVAQIAGSYLTATAFSSHSVLYVAIGICVVCLLLMVGYFYYSQASQSRGMKAN